jgi:tRNA threonylcarbamoyl adenosine modification protein YeaZ
MSSLDEYCLFLDHSTSDRIGALMKDGLVVESCRCDQGLFRHPCRTWQLLLDRHGLQRKDVSFFACGIGPGSYTGIRSAAATVQAAAFAMKKPIVALSSLLLCVPFEEGAYLALADAGPGGAFVQCVTIRAGQCHVLRPERMGVAEALELIQPGLTPVSVSEEWICKKVQKRADIRVVPAHADTAALFAFQEWHSGHGCDALKLPLEYPRKV